MPYSGQGSSVKISDRSDPLSLRPWNNSGWSSSHPPLRPFQRHHHPFFLNPSMPGRFLPPGLGAPPRGTAQPPYYKSPGSLRINFSLPVTSGAHKRVPAKCKSRESWDPIHGGHGCRQPGSWGKGCSQWRWVGRAGSWLLNNGWVSWRLRLVCKGRRLPGKSGHTQRCCTKALASLAGIRLDSAFPWDLGLSVQSLQRGVFI